MQLETIKQSLQETYAKDIKLNLTSVLAEEALNHKQVIAIALACAFSLQNKELALALQEGESLEGATIKAAKGAATVMAMNNVYYRFIHLVNNKDYQSLPARLRMNFIANPGIDKQDFELMCLAVSALNGCGLCIESHTKHLEKAAVSQAAIQQTIKIAAVLHATDSALFVAQG